MGQNPEPGGQADGSRPRADAGGRGSNHVACLMPRRCDAITRRVSPAATWLRDVGRLHVEKRRRAGIVQNDYTVCPNFER